MSFRWQTSGRGPATLESLRTFIDEVTADLDPESRYVRELLEVFEGSESVEAYLARLEDPSRVETFQQDGAQASQGERGRSWVDDEIWANMDAYERTLANLLTGETRMMWAGEGARNYALLPEVLANIAPPRRLLSVPCSIGKEPYSLGIAALAAGLEVEVVGVDRQADYVAKAASGRLVPHWRDLELEGVSAYLEQQDSGQVAVSAGLRSICSFAQGDVLTGELPAGPFGLVSCRNLLGYFRGTSLELALENVSGRVAPGGYLLLDYYVSDHPDMALAQRLLAAGQWKRVYADADFYRAPG